MAEEAKVEAARTAEGVKTVEVMGTVEKRRQRSRTTPLRNWKAPLKISLVERKR